MSWRDFKKPFPDDKGDEGDNAPSTTTTLSPLSPLSPGSRFKKAAIKKENTQKAFFSDVRDEGDNDDDAQLSAQPDALNLQWWIEQLKECATREEVLALLRKFQPLDWTDQERATMAHAYHKRLESVPAERLPAAWYEIEQTLRTLVPGLSFQHSASLIKRQVAQQTQSEQAQILKQLEAWSARHTHRDWARQLIKAVVE